MSLLSLLGTVAVKVHGCYIVVIGGKQQQSVSLEIIVVCRAYSLWLCCVRCRFACLANQGGFAGSENGEVTFEKTWGVC